MHADALLILGVSGCLVLPLVRLFFPKKKIITNIDGIEWKREKWGKIAKTFLRISEKFAALFSHKLIADNKYIQQHIEENYSISSVYIPYGGDHVLEDIDNPLTKAQEKSLSHLPKKYACTVCRIEPENNIEMILQTFASMSDKNLIFVGNWKNSDFGKKMYQEYGKVENIYLLDPIE